MLRVKGDIVETSKNARFPISHAKRALRAVEHCRATKTTFTPNGSRLKLGYFQVDRIDHNGNVKAGCHFVKYEQIARIASEIRAWCEG
jgi:hypothetical protein